MTFKEVKTEHNQNSISVGWLNPDPPSIWPVVNEAHHLSCSGWVRYIKWAWLRSTWLTPDEPSGNSKSPQPGLPAWESSEAEAMSPTLSTAHMDNNIVQGKSCLNRFVHMAQLLMLRRSIFSWICKFYPKIKKISFSFSLFPGTHAHTEIRTMVMMTQK